MLQKFFDWFDEAASNVLRLAYLVPFVLATAQYFGGDPLAFILAFGVEFQTYSSVRKMAVVWNGLKAPALDDFQRGQLQKEMKAQIITVIALATFSVWNQMSYLSENWHPSTSAFGAPRWLDILIRSVGPAVFFFLTAFGAPLAKTIGEKLGEEAHKTLESFLGVVKKQRKNAIKQIDAQMVDMAPAIQTVASAAREPKVGAVLASVQGAIVGLAKGEAPPVSAAPSSIPAPRSGHSTKSYEEACRTAWREGMGADELAGIVGCSPKTAARYVKKFQDAFVVSPRITAVK